MEAPVAVEATPASTTCTVTSSPLSSTCGTVTTATGAETSPPAGGDTDTALHRAAAVTLPSKPS
eukprot:1184458-Prorocentrum_minimum.AAC.3